jgi:hypothetical protein
MAYCNGDPVLERLFKLLGIPDNATDVVIRFPAGDLATMTITKLLTTEDVDALSEWYITEGIQPRLTGTTTYNLEQCPVPAEGEQG